MKNKLNLLIRTLVFIAIFTACIFAVSLVVQRKSSYIKNEMFFKEAKENHIDALFFGSSHVINGINPVELYKDHGITAYNLGGYGSVLLSSYWQMKLALDYCEPKVVFIDSYMLENDIRYIDDPNANVSSDELHLNIDRFPLGKTKLDAINDMFENQDKKYPYLFDFLVYHDRWKELEADDFNRLTGTANINRKMGADLVYEVHSAEFNYTDYGTGMLPGETVGTEYLRRMIDECNQRGIQVVVMTLPFLAQEENQQAAHTASQIAREYGALDINLLEVPGIVDYNTDFQDAGHMNVLGATKVTGFIGNWAAENLDLPDHREDENYSVWNECLEEYDEELKGMVQGNEDLYAQCLFLDIEKQKRSFVISIMGGSKSLYDETFIRQLKALGAGEALDNAVMNMSSYLLISDKGTVTEFCGDGEMQTIETSQGTISYEGAGDVYRVLYVGDDYETNYLYSDQNAYADVQILFYKKGKVKSHQYYTCDHFTYEYDQS